MRCVAGGGGRLSKAGHDTDGRQRYRCCRCGRRHTERSRSAFSGYRFPEAIIGLAVRWYLQYRMSYANVAELLAERGIFAWVQHFAPLYQEAARPHRHRVRRRWAIDETYIKVAGVPCYVFRAIDDLGPVIDVYVSPTRDTAAASTFLLQAVARTGVRPHTVTTDKAPIYPPALQLALPEVEHRTSKADQQGIERDHQHLKGRYRPMRGFEALGCAQTVCAGHGFIRNVREGFYRLGIVLGDPRVRRAPRLMVAWDEITGLLQAA